MRFTIFLTLCAIGVASVSSLNKRSFIDDIQNKTQNAFHAFEEFSEQAKHNAEEGLKKLLDFFSQFNPQSDSSNAVNVTKRADHDMREYKIVVLGSSGVGKSALTVQFVSGTFMESYNPTIKDFYRKFIEVDGAPCALEILDTPGAQQFASMRDSYIKNGQGFVVVYSITSHQTFQDVKTIKEQIIRLNGGNEKIPILLVGNKIDLDHQREVSTAEGRTLARAWRCPFMETSAKNKFNADEVFANAVREMKK